MRALGFDVKKPEVLKILQTSGSERGLLSQDEFTRTMTEYILQRDPLEEIRRAFQLFDDDGTGKISIKNLRRVAKELGEVLEEEELLAMIEVSLDTILDLGADMQEFDLDMDGEINEQEFINIMTDGA
jgi:centrin-3